MPTLTLKDLDNRVQTLEKYLRNIKIFIIFLSFLGITGGGAFLYIINSVKTVKDAKNIALEARIRTESAAKEANNFLKEIKAMDIQNIMKELDIAERDYRKISENIKTTSDQYKAISAEYDIMIKQLTDNIYVQISPPTAVNEKVYLKGDGILSIESKEAELEGKKALKRRIWLTFDDSTRSIFSVLAREETLKVKFLFSK